MVPPWSQGKEYGVFWFGCKHIFGVSLNRQRPDGSYAPPVLYTTSAFSASVQNRFSGGWSDRFFHLLFLATLGSSCASALGESFAHGSRKMKPGCKRHDKRVIMPQVCIPYPA